MIFSAPSGASNRRRNIPGDRKTARTSKHRRTGPSALASTIHPAETGKEILRIDTGLLGLVELVRKDVEHQLAVAVRVDMPMRLLVEKVLEPLRVDEVSVVRKTDAVGAVDVERLRLGVGATSSRRISKMGQAHEARKIADACAVVEDLGRHAVALALVHPASGRRDRNAGSILSTMLKEVERLMQLKGG